MKAVMSCLLLSLLITVGYSQKIDTVRQIKIKKGDRYLNLPVKESEPLQRATISLNGKPLDRFTIKLSDQPDYWVFFDVTPYQGKTLTFTLSKVPVTMPQQAQVTPVANVSNDKRTTLLNMVVSAPTYPGLENLYKEKDRPQAHFTANRGWLNDPNGLIYYGGQYHLYFQHNPYGWPWGNMHWGHAVSKDLVSWQQLPEAIYPYLEADLARPDAAFSGSAITDPQNTSGFRKNGIDPLIAFYTSTGRGECIKLSYDNGNTFEEYAGNPILKHNGRDPKILWYAPGKHWVMVVWEQGKPKKLSMGQEAMIREHSIYTSPNMKDWTYQSGVQGFFECPDLFELPVEGTNTSKWVMYDAHGRYVVGTFDGKNFNVEQPFKVFAHGGGYFYASQTYNDAPDGKRIQIGWGRNITHPGMPFNQPMLFPTELKLRNTFDGIRLTPTPIPAISKLHKNSKVIENKVVSDEKVVVEPNGRAFHVIANIERGDAPISLNVNGYELKFDNEWVFSTASNEEVKPTQAPAGPFPPPSASVPVTYVPSGDNLKLEVIMDGNTLEAFVNDGELYYVTAFNGQPTGKVELGIAGSGNRSRVTRKFILKKLEVHELSSIWESK
ncbi:MAG TPA: hypothetical protein VFE50_06045 [Cyclobacteriaceae bacterium]|nr:hypothetical protein [Cyclobacteriaceae bacterium]